MDATCGQSSGRRSRIWVSTVVVKGELHRVWPQPYGVDLVLALPPDPRLDQVLAEHAALRQEGMIGLECVERRVERARHLGDTAIVFEQVEVCRLARVETALDPVEAGHEHRGEREV